jgi:hypothetical protein
MTVMTAASISRSTVHHHVAKGVRLARETMRDHSGTGNMRSRLDYGCQNVKENFPLRQNRRGDRYL